ncbi:MAG: hypothetical protein KJ667_01565, partial [Alphaproteobacteria bacterium]|nr:hypothetical protein [Alphaproteobacteria bacterium]
MKKKAALTLAALFVAAATLAGCKDDAPAQKTTPSGGIDIYDTSFLDRQYLITIDDMAIRTATGRELHVTTRAFCQIEEDKHRTLEAYKAACREIIGEKLL